MRRTIGASLVSIAAATGLIGGVVVTVMWIRAEPTAGQQRDYQAPRTADGRPDLNGIWQALGTADWNLEDHAPRPSPVVALGARGAIPAGSGVVVGGAIPYQPWASAKKKENFENWLTRDPTIKCFMPGVPRATYMSPFQIIQGSNSDVLIAYEFADATRVVFMSGGDEESPVETWMGWSRGRWEGETLVVDVNSFNDQTWFDSAGNFHSNALHVVERYTPTGPDHLLYEATIEDPEVFTGPWTIRMPLYRRVEENARLHEFKCVEFAEEVMYGHLRRKNPE